MMESKNSRRIRITATGKVLEQLTKFEIIEEAEKYWKPMFEQGKFELGKAVVLFPCMEFGEVSYVCANYMPQPTIITLKKGWNKGLRAVIKMLENEGFYVIKTNDSGHRKVDEDLQKKVMDEVNKKLKMNKYI